MMVKLHRAKLQLLTGGFWGKTNAMFVLVSAGTNDFYCDQSQKLEAYSSFALQNSFTLPGCMPYGSKYVAG